QLATAWQSGGRVQRAERAWRRLLDAREAAGAPPADIAAVRERIADCLTAREQRGEALAMRLRAMGERAPAPAPADATRTSVRRPASVGAAPDEAPLDDRPRRNPSRREAAPLHGGAAIPDEQPH